MNRRTFRAIDYNKKPTSKEETQIFIIYEGEDKEPRYFESFNKLYLQGRKVIIHHILEKSTIVNGTQPRKLIERVEEFKNNPPNNLFLSEGDKIRFVLDKDEHPEEQFVELIKYCESLTDANLFISNYCFEVWLYLHLGNHEEIISNSSSEMKTELGNKHTSQKINYPKGYLTKERIKKAIERAENADKDKNNYFPVEKSTKVYLLIKELLEYSILNIDVEENN
jgi:hypothetical protein